MTSAWTPVACEIAGVIRHSEHVSPVSGRSDLDGQWGEPCIYTEWATRERQVPVLREWRYPSRTPGEPDPRPCRHEVPTPNEEGS